MTVAIKQMIKVESLISAKASVPAMMVTAHVLQFAQFPAKRLMMPCIMFTCACMASIRSFIGSSMLYDLSSYEPDLFFTQRLMFFFRYLIEDI